MYKFPISHFESNLIFNEERKECWAAYKLVGYNYDFKSTDGKKRILNMLSRFLVNIGKEAAIYVIPIAQDIEEHYKRIIDNLNKKDVFYIQAKSHAEQTQAYLEETLKLKGDANDYKVYVLTKISISDSKIESIKEALKYFIQEPAQGLEELLGVNYKDIFEKDINMFLKLSEEYFRKQNRRISMNKCDALDTEWLMRRVYYRGIGNFKLRGTEENNWTPFTEMIVKNGEKAIRVEDREVLKLSEGIIDVSDGRYIKVVHDNKTSYQAFLPISYIPDGIVFPNNEWLLALQDYPQQTEVIIRISTIEHKQSLRNIDKKKKEIKDQIDHINQSNEELPEELEVSMENANTLEAELKASRSPMSNVSITFCLFDSSKENLEAKIDFIKEKYMDNNFIIERPLADQMKLFMESIPGSPRYVNDYIQPIPPRTLAGAIIGATRILGDNIGHYIGTTGILKKSVFLDISRACKLNRSASAGFYGTLGGGKSFLANLIFYLSVLYGGYGLAIDPKGDRGNWIKDLPEFKDNINLTTLSAEKEDRGKLDPFIIYRDNLEEAAYLAISIISELLNITPKDEEYIVALEAINWVKKEDNPCMVKVANKLMNMDDDPDLGRVAKLLGRKIMMFKEMAMAGLLFGEGNEEGLDFKKRINILQIQNLSMPRSDKPKEEYTQEEVLSTVLMLPIASFARKFIHMDRRFFKIVQFDESWALEATESGRKMMSTLNREGRALYAGCLFISQSTKDTKDEGIKSNLSYKFCFKATEKKEIQSVLEFLDLEITEDNMNIVRNLENGECLFQDLDGRVGILKVDAVFEHLIKKAFNTNPEKFQKEGA